MFPAASRDPVNEYERRLVALLRKDRRAAVATALEPLARLWYLALTLEGFPDRPFSPSDEKRLFVLRHIIEEMIGSVLYAGLVEVGLRDPNEIPVVEESPKQPKRFRKSRQREGR